MGDFVNNPVPIIQEEVITLKLKNEELEKQVEKYKAEKKYYDNLCHKRTVECDDLRKGIEQFQLDNEQFIKRIAELENENESNELALNEGEEIIAELEGQNKILTTRILELQKTCGALTDKVEKMKNAGNCKHFIECTKINEKELILGKIVTCKGCKKWEMAE